MVLENPRVVLLALAMLLCPAFLGMTGCGQPNEADFAKYPGHEDPDTPKTAEEYEKKYGERGIYTPSAKKARSQAK